MAPRVATKIINKRAEAEWPIQQFLQLELYLKAIPEADRDIYQKKALGILASGKSRGFDTLSAKQLRLLSVQTGYMTGIRSFPTKASPKKTRMYKNNPKLADVSLASIPGYFSRNPVNSRIIYESQVGAVWYRTIHRLKYSRLDMPNVVDKWKSVKSFAKSIGPIPKDAYSVFHADITKPLGPNNFYFANKSKERVTVNRLRMFIYRLFGI